MWENGESNRLESENRRLHFKIDESLKGRETGLWGMRQAHGKWIRILRYKRSSQTKRAKLIKISLAEQYMMS